MKLSIIIPIRNEKESIVQTLNILKDKLKQIDYELVIINDSEKFVVILKEIYIVAAYIIYTLL